MAYIKLIEPSEAEGELKLIYDNLSQARGKVAEIHKAQSLNPKTIVRHMELYLATMFGASPLKRPQREMLAVVVSAVNKCDYCQVHHAKALEAYWKNEERVARLRRDFKSADLDAGDLALCAYAEALTRDPAGISSAIHIQPMKDAGWDDRVILDAANVICYFNYVNRLVLGLGIQLEADGGGGYKY